MSLSESLEREYFHSLESVWESVKNARKPVCLYGMGNGAQKILDACNQKGIAVSEVFASDDFVRGQSFCGYTVKTLNEIESQYDDFIVLLAFGTNLPEILSRIDNIESRHRLFAPDAAVIGTEVFEKERFLANFSRAQRAYSLLADESSRKTFIGLTAYKITGRLDFLREIFTADEKSYQLINPGKNEIYCDLGAYNGDTVLKFCEFTSCSYRKIYAAEPEKRNFQKCVKNCISLDNIGFYNCAVSERDGVSGFSFGSGRQAKLDGSGGCDIAVRSLDSILGGKECTFIKYDVEGAEIPALNGSAQTIRTYAPKISCALYHRCFDYIDIVLHIDSLRKGYRFFMRQSAYYPAWETNLFCI